MKVWAMLQWERMRTSFWFLPCLLVASSLLAAWLLLLADENWQDDLVGRFRNLGAVSPEGTRVIMGTAATAMLSLAGITFSGTLVALTLASSQFGPRLLRNFIRARSTQMTLAMLLSTFVYCLVVLRSIRSGEDSDFVPHLSAFAWFVFTLLSLGFFIFFIHRISTSLQADRVAADVHKELSVAIHRIFPDARPTDEEESNAGDESDVWEEIEEETPLNSPVDGYLQAVDLESLVTAAEKLDLRCRVLKRPGHFLAQGIPIFAVSGSADFDEAEAEAFLGCLLIGPQRTP